MKITEERLKKIIREEVGANPLALSVLGAPAAGKTYTKKLVGKLAKRVQKASDKGEDLTVDIIRDKFQKQSAKYQLQEFFKSFYTLRDYSKKYPKFTPWFKDVKNMWNNRMAQLVSNGANVKMSADDNAIYMNDKKVSVDDFLSAISGNEERVVGSLHPYKDYKRVVRHLQLMGAEKSVSDKKDVLFDETGDEPEKIIPRIDKLHKDKYITDVIMVHPSSVIVNLLQNASRMINGGDGGRDSSSAIIQAYNDIDQGKKEYDNNSEVVIDTSSQKLTNDPNVEKALSDANVADDKERGNKPIDVLVNVDTQSVNDTFNRVSKELSKNSRAVLKAILVVQANDPSMGLGEEERSELSKSIPDLPSLQAAKKIIATVKNSSDVNNDFGMPMTGVLNMKINESKRERVSAMKITESKLKRIIKEEMKNMYGRKIDFPAKGYEGFYEELELGNMGVEYHHEHPETGIYVRVFQMAEDLWRVSIMRGGTSMAVETYDNKEDALENGVSLYSEEMLNYDSGYNPRISRR